MTQGREAIGDVIVETAPVPGVLLVASGGGADHRLLARGDGVVTVGRSIASVGGRVVLDDGRLSREHATIERAGSDWIIRDLASRNGTFVDGRRIGDTVQVRGDAVVRCGGTVLLLLADVRDHDRDLDIADWIVGPELSRVLADAARRSSTAGGATLLVQGENGAGKKLVARHFHDQGPRRSGPFVAVDCTRFAGGDRPAGEGTGAVAGGDDVTGPLEAAAGGTLFLDEVAELDLPAQARLLRAIEARDVVVAGASDGVGIGVVAASHRDLRGAVAARRFRQDLYYRLARAVVIVPPLRQRRGDIPRLVAREVARIDPGLSLHPRLIEGCCIRPWPGNVRQLQQVIRDAARSALAADRDQVRPEDLPASAGHVVVDEPSSITTGSRPKVSPAEVDRDAVEAAMAAASGNVSAAARALGLHRTQLYRLLQRFGTGRASDDA